MPLVPSLLLALACGARAQSIDLKAMKEAAAKGESVSPRPVELPPGFVLQVDNPPPPEDKDIDHSKQNPALQGEDEETAALKDRAGLTETHIKPHLEIEWAYDKDRAWIDKANLRFGITQRLSVSSFYAEKSCPYGATKSHELGHWNDNKAFLEEEAAGLKQDLIGLGLPTKDKPILAKDEDAVAGKIAAAVKFHQKNFTSRALKARSERDEPDAYLKNDYSKCKPADWRTHDP
jgi:hypothetical protein